MFTDAISSEAYKLWRNRGALFWAFLFIPLLAFASDLIADLWMRPAMAQGMPIPQPDYPRQFLMKMSQAAGFFTVAFAAMGAAVIFAGDYRWETWRLIGPRNSRINHMLAKIGVFALATMVTVILVALFGILATWIGATVHKASIPAGGEAIPGGTYAIVLVSLFLVSWLQILVVGATVALTAVLTRSIMAAFMLPLFLYVVLAMASQSQQLLGADPTHPEFWRLLLLPGFAAQVLQLHVGSKQLMGQQMIESGVAGQALTALLIWIVAGFGAATAIFQRQDLSKE